MYHIPLGFEEFATEVLGESVAESLIAQKQIVRTEQFATGFVGVILGF